MTEQGARKIKEIFTESQHSVTSHKKLQSQMKRLSDTLPEKVFFTTFTECLKVPLTYGLKIPTVERALDFAVNFSVSIISKKTTQGEERPADPELDDDDEMPKFLLNLFKFLCEHVGVENQVIRFRICQFINKLLNGLGNEACVDDDLCDQLMECLMERLKDKSPSVRTQAVRALYRLQDPLDPDCLVTKAFSFHISCDPSADVRATILTNIAISTHSVRLILERTRDMSDIVRKVAYFRVAELSIQRFSIEQRVRLLERGLKDHSEKVRKCVSTDLLRSWLEFHKGKFVSFLHALDCEHSTDTSTLALETMFKSTKATLTNAVEQLKGLQSPDKLIPIEELSPENVLFWKVVTKYLDAHPEIADERPIDEPFEELLPELSSFCNYIRKFFDRHSPGEEPWVHAQREYILKQLFEISKDFDLGDEMGRANLRTLCQEMLMNDRVSDGVVRCLVEVMEKVIPDDDDRLQSLAEVISELRDPLTEAEETEDAAEPEAPQLSVEERRQLEIKEAKIRIKLNELTEEQDEAAKAKDFRRAQELLDECQALRDQLATMSAPPPPPPPPPKPATQEARNDEVVIKDKTKLRKCLCIVQEMMQTPTVVSLTPTLRSLMHNFVMPCLEQVDESDIRNLALNAMGLFCLLDVDLAKQHFVYMFCFQIANDEVCETALKITFDLLHQYGLETFEVEQENEDGTGKKRVKKKKNLFVTETCEDEFEDEDETQSQTLNTTKANTANLISMLTSLLGSTSITMRNLAMEGLCKLLLACRMTSPALLSRLILMWHSPVTDGDEDFRQTIAAFLKALSTICPRGPEMLEQAFLPTIRTLREAPADSPLSLVDQEGVAKLLISLTRPGLNRFHKKQSTHVHNALAVSLCNEILNQEDLCMDEVALLRCLLQLELALDDQVFRQDLNVFANSMRNMFVLRKEKGLVNYTDRFAKMINQGDAEAAPPVAEVDNTARTDQLNGTERTNNDVRLSGAERSVDTALLNSTEQTNGTSTSVLKKSRKNAKILKKGEVCLDDFGNDSDGSDDDSTSRMSDGVVIPETPEKSQRSRSPSETSDAEAQSPVSKRQKVAKGSEKEKESTDTKDIEGEEETREDEPRKQSKESKKKQQTHNADPAAKEVLPLPRRAGKRKSAGADSVADQPSSEETEIAETEPAETARKRHAKEPAKFAKTPRPAPETVAPQEHETGRKRRSVDIDQPATTAEPAKKKAAAKQPSQETNKAKKNKADNKPIEESPAVARPRREVKLTLKAIAYKENRAKGHSPVAPPSRNDPSPARSSASGESSVSPPTTKRRAVEEPRRRRIIEEPPESAAKSSEPENSPPKSPQKTKTAETAEQRKSGRTASASQERAPKSPQKTKTVEPAEQRKSGRTSSSPQEKAPKSPQKTKTVEPAEQRKADKTASQEKTPNTPVMTRRSAVQQSSVEAAPTGRTRPTVPASPKATKKTTFAETDKTEPSQKRSSRQTTSPRSESLSSSSESPSPTVTRRTRRSTHESPQSSKKTVPPPKKAKLVADKPEQPQKNSTRQKSPLRSDSSPSPRKPSSSQSPVMPRRTRQAADASTPNVPDSRTKSKQADSKDPKSLAAKEAVSSPATPYPTKRPERRAGAQITPAREVSPLITPPSALRSSAASKTTEKAKKNVATTVRAPENTPSPAVRSARSKALSRDPSTPSSDSPSERSSRSASSRGKASQNDTDQDSPAVQTRKGTSTAKDNTPARKQAKTPSTSSKTDSKKPSGQNLRKSLTRISTGSSSSPSMSTRSGEMPNKLRSRKRL